ncbi:MAG: alpha/beta hydrolase family protein [Synechococcus sp.]
MAAKARAADLAREAVAAAVEVEEALVGQLTDQIVVLLENLEVLVVEELLLIMVGHLVHQLQEDQVIHLLLHLLKEIMEVQHLFIHHLELVDLEAVLEAQQRGDLNIPGTEVVLMGHSLGALTALLASGAELVPGMAQRCEAALAGLPLTNLSELLQCELAAGRVLESKAMDPPPRAVVGLNSFGGLIWPHRASRALPIPLLMVGGTLDLITPPLDEQLALLAGLAEHPASRVVVVEGASHFSPIRVDGQGKASEGDDIFRLGEELVGVNPLSVQRVIAHEVIRFLDSLSSTSPRNDAVHLMDASSKTRWHRLGRRRAQQLLDQ